MKKKAYKRKFIPPRKKILFVTSSMKGSFYDGLKPLRDKYDLLIVHSSQLCSELLSSLTIDLLMTNPPLRSTTHIEERGIYYTLMMARKNCDLPLVLVSMVTVGEILYAKGEYDYKKSFSHERDSLFRLVDEILKE